MQWERYRIADLTVDVEAVSVVHQDGRSLALPRLSFDLLVALARRAPAVVRTDELIDTVWAGIAVSDETLTQRVALLRRALGDDAKNPRYVRAVRGRGYQLIPEVRAVSEKERPPRSRRLVPASIAAALGIVGLAAVLLVFTRSDAPIATHSPGAPELISRAGSYLRQHQEADNEIAIELYRRALRLEPENPRALAGLSLALGQRATKFNRRAEASDQALAVARRALAANPRLGGAHHALGLALDSQGQVSGALAAYLQAAELDPEPAPALASAAYLLQVQGHLAAALETNLRAARAAGGDPPPYLEIQMGETLALLGFEPAAEVWLERAVELRPDNVFAAASLAGLRLSQARPREADEIAARALQRGIRRPELAEIRGRVALLQGDEARARAFFEQALAIEPRCLSAKARLLLLSRPDLDRQGRELADAARRGRTAGDEWPGSAIDEMLLEAGLGRDDAAIRALDDAIVLGYREWRWLRLDPMLAGLRDDPRLASRIEKIRRLIGAERQRVAGAAWLPPALLAGSAARM